MSTIAARQQVTWSRLIRRVPILGPVELRDFRLLWAGEGVSLLGDQFHFVALATLVFALTGSGLALGTVMFAGFGAGAVIGAVIAGSTARPRRFGMVVLGLAIVFAVQLAALGLAPNALLATAGLVGAGLAAGYLNVTVTSWLQARTDSGLLGRVMSLVMLGAVGLQPVSFAIAGVLVDAYATPMYLLAGGLILAAVAAALIGGAHATLDGKESVS